MLYLKEGHAEKSIGIFFLVNAIISIALGFIDHALATPGSEVGAGVIGSIYSFAVLLPAIAVGVRRLHDTERTGWWLLIAIIPVVGVLVLIYFFALDSEPGTNKYGVNPKH